MDFKFAIDGGNGGQASSACSGEVNAAKPAPAVIVLACRKRRRENMSPPVDRL
jgi:hypothetical protein